jgi:hypothetical protein
VSPTDNILLSTTTPLLNWRNSSVYFGASVFYKYEVQLATDKNFSSEITNIDVPEITNSQTNSPMLRNGTTYYWRVRSVNVGDDTIGGSTDDQYSSWSPSRSFRIAYSAPVLEQPVDEVTDVALKPTFTWIAIPGAISYILQVSRTNTFTGLVINRNITAAAITYTHATNLLPNTKYYWRVRANGPYGPGAWQAIIFSFTTTP